MSYKVKLSLPGYDVHTATPEQCAVDSDYPSLKAKLGQSPAHIGLLDVDFTGAIPQNNTITLYSFSHGYDYIPLVLGNIILSGVSGGPIVGVGYAGVGTTLVIKAEATSSIFRVTIYDDFNWVTSSSRLQVSFYVFAENGT